MQWILNVSSDFFSHPNSILLFIHSFYSLFHFSTHTNNPNEIKCIKLFMLQTWTFNWTGAWATYTQRKFYKSREVRPFKWVFHLLAIDLTAIWSGFPCTCSKHKLKSKQSCLKWICTRQVEQRSKIYFIVKKNESG